MVLFIEISNELQLTYFALEPSAGVFVCFKAYSQTKVLNSQHQEVVIHYIFKESVNLQSLVFKCISLTKYT